QALLSQPTVNSTILALPGELWSRIFLLLDSAHLSALAETCRHFLSLTRGAYFRACFIWSRYGHNSPLALHYAFTHHMPILSPDVGDLLSGACVAKATGQGDGRSISTLNPVSCYGQRVVAEDGSVAPPAIKIPRFLLQSVVKRQALSIARASPSERVGRNVPAPLYAWFIAEGFKLYGANVSGIPCNSQQRQMEMQIAETIPKSDFTGDDSDAFLDAAFEPNPDTLHNLLFRYLYVPTRQTLQFPQFRDAIYRASECDISFLDAMIANGLHREIVNGYIMRTVVMESEVTAELLAQYLNRGFTITTSIAKVGLRKCDPEVLEAFKAVGVPDMQKLAMEVFHDNLGEEFSFSAGLWQFLQANFRIGEDLIEKALFTHPDQNDTEDAGSEPVFQTRPARQTEPSDAFRHILLTYGTSHHFTQVCFADALCLLGRSRNIGELVFEYVRAGVRFTPKHVQRLAFCRSQSCVTGGEPVSVVVSELLELIREQVAASVDEGKMDGDELRLWWEACRATSKLWNSVRAQKWQGNPRGPAWVVREMDLLAADIVKWGGDEVAASHVDSNKEAI
ncbi:hypothetical protein HK097_003039, partial [Rhizophlyctis rosea]